MQRVVQAGCFIHAVLLLGLHLKRWGALFSSGRLLPKLTEARALSITLTRASSLGSLSENFKQPQYWFSPPPTLHLGNGIQLSPHRARERKRERRAEVERELKKKKGWKVKETQRDERKRGDVWPLHNNTGDPTLLHCSNSCKLQITESGNQTSSDYRIYTMPIMH